MTNGTYIYTRGKVAALPFPNSQRSDGVSLIKAGISTVELLHV